MRTQSSAQRKSPTLDDFEGLVRKTARLIVQELARRGHDAENDLEDIEQLLRVKVWKALVAFDPARCRTTPKKYVFMCVKDQGKDILKKRRRHFDYIEEIAPIEPGMGELSHQRSRDRFLMENGLFESHDEIYGMVDAEAVLVPNTLSVLERRILVMLYRDYKQSEVARLLSLEKRDMERHVRAIRQKMADWQPTETESELAVAA